MRIPFITFNLQYLAAFVAALTYLMSGMVSGWASPILPRLQEPGSPLPITSSDASWVVSIPTLSAIASKVSVPYVVEIVGRKPMLASAAVPVFASWLMVLFAESAGMLIASRVVAGLGLGIATCCVPMYVGEVAEASVRGALGTFFQFTMSLGGLIAYCLGPYLSYEAVAIVSAAVPVAFLLLFVWMPESPYFLAMRGRDKDAERALRRLRGAVTDDAIQEEMALIQKTVEEQRSRARPQLQLLVQLVRRRGSRRALTVCVVLITVQSLTGLTTLLGYATQVFRQSGVSLDADVCSIVIGAVQTLSSVGTYLLVDRAGRRPLLMISCAGCALMMAAQATVFYLNDNDVDLSAVQWLPLATFVAFLVFNILGIGPLPWVITGEVFPAELKSVATSVVAVTLGVMTSTLGKLFQVVTDAVGMYAIFYAFAGFSAIGCVFTFFFVPETKGRTFLQITQKFEGITAEPTKNQP